MPLPRGDEALYLVHVYADSAASWANLLGSEEDIEPGTGPKVNDGLSLILPLVALYMCEECLCYTSRRLAMARGFPQLSPKLDSAGILWSSSSVYPKDCATDLLYPGLDCAGAEDNAL